MSSSRGTGSTGQSPARIAVGINGYPEGRDAAVLAVSIANVTGAELMLVAVHPAPLVVVPDELGWAELHKQAEKLLRETRDQLAPGARITVETDWSVPRALARVVAREHRDLLIVGSSRRAPEGRVRIGGTRQVLSHFERALAVAPRGIANAAEHRLARIGVGYDGGPESNAALSFAASLAIAAGAKLLVHAVVDDRIPIAGWTQAGRDRVLAMWEELLEPQAQALTTDAERAAAATGADAEVRVLRGSPALKLRGLSEQVDLLVIGSRRWGAAARTLLGSTGEGLMHDGSCPILVVPRPSD